jgi:hypothetical protein
VNSLFEGYKAKNFSAVTCEEALAMKGRFSPKDDVRLEKFTKARLDQQNLDRVCLVLEPLTAQSNSHLKITSAQVHSHLNASHRSTSTE